jgi:uncharacterized repeat protein (TIGR03803 family)
MYKFAKHFFSVCNLTIVFFFMLIMPAAKAQDVLTGLTSNGGPEGRGTAFSIKSNGTGFSIIKGFADWGRTPNGDLYRHSDGNFYGMTQRGGTYDAGTIFKMSSTGTITVLRSLDYANDGAYPYGELIKGNDGNLYGMTSSGGVSTSGTIFKITTSGVYTVVKNFNYSNGANAQGHLVLSSDGNFYGATVSGGAAGSGVVFKMTSAGTITVLHSFNGGSDGLYCYGSITEGKDGNLYGITNQGGTFGYGTIFKMNKTGSSFTVLRNLNNTNDGGYSKSDLIQATDGNFYSMALSGGTNNQGTIFKITPTGTFNVIRNLGSTNGQNPIGNLFQNTDGFLYGMAHGGANGGGTFFKVSTGGAFTLLHSFTWATEGGDPNGGLIRSTDGSLYGLTSTEGPNFGGTAFKITTAGSFTRLASFDGATLGNAPYESLLRGSDSAFYGTTNNKGAKQYYGTIFKICAGNTTLLHTFNGSQGGYPNGSLVQATNGVFYGTTEYGGTNNAGTIFKITKSGTYTVLRNLSSSTDGANPVGSLIQATDGNLYGTTAYGGTYNGGTIFKISLTGTYTVLRHLNTADGYYPLGDLFQGTDGNFYGTTSVGGNNGVGTIFKITPAKVYTVLRALTQSTDGSNPKGSLVQHSNGNFYGMTFQGGTNGGGTIFRISSTGTFAVLRHLNPTPDGKAPQGKLLIGSDGNLYGMTYSGGANNAGTIFKITTTGTYTVLRHLDLRKDGGNPYGTLIISPPNTLIANAQSVSTKEDTKKTITLSGSGGAPLGFSIVSTPKHGTLTGTGASRSFTPSLNYSGKDSFTFKVTVGCAASLPAKVNISITAVPDTPVLAAIGNKSVVKNTTLTFTAKATDGDNGQTLTFSLINAPAGASINATTGVFTWTPTVTGNFTFKVRVTDNSSGALFDEETITVSVTATLARDGVFSNSTEPEILQASIYPNPVSNNLTVMFNSYITHVSATIMDVRGSTIRKSELQLNGKNRIELDVATLQPGTYFILLQTINGVQTSKFIKL